MDSKIIPYVNSVFEQPWWLDTVAPGKWGEAIVKENNKIIARLPYVFDNGKIKNPTYTQTLGIWMDESLKNFQKGNSQLHKQKEIIAELLSQLPKNNQIDVIFDSSLKYILPFRWHGFNIEPTFSYRITNLRNMDFVNERIGKTVEKNIKTALKKVTVDCDSKDFESLIKLQNMTYSRQNRRNPIDEQLTLHVMQKAIEYGSGRLMIALDEEENIHSAAFFLYDEKICYYLMGGQNSKFKNYGSQNLLLSEGIKFAASVSKSFDFEGSMVEGIENFFRQFGGEQVINYHVSKRTLLGDIAYVTKPHIKKILGYKI